MLALDNPLLAPINNPLSAPINKPPEQCKPANSLALTFVLNAQGISPSVHSQRWKIPYIEDWIADQSHHIPFFVLTETHLSNTHLDAEVKITNFATIRTDRFGRRKGGAAIFLHDSLTADARDLFSNGLCESVSVYNKANDLTLIGLYRPPQAAPVCFQECLDRVKLFVRQHDPGNILMMGDFNLPCIDWSSNTLKLGISHSIPDKAAVESLFDFMDDFFLSQFVLEPTRGNKSVLDLVLTNYSSSIHSISVEKTLLSDHDMVLCKLRFQYPKTEHPHPTTRIPTHAFDTLNLHKANWGAIRQHLSLVDWSFTHTSSDITASWQRFEDIVTNACSKHTPTKPVNRTKARSRPSREKKTLIRKIKRLNRKINQLKYHQQQHPQSTAIKTLESKKYHLQSNMKTLINKQRAAEENWAIEKIKLNPRVFYAFANKHRTAESPIGPLTDANNVLHSDDTEMAEILQKQYCSVFSDPTEVDLCSFSEVKPQHTISDITFGPPEIIAAINAIKLHSAAGPDKFPASVLKECRHHLASPLANLWRKSLDAGFIPNHFLAQSVIPVFKKGNKSLAVNYRPISLTSHIIKAFERVVRSGISGFLEGSNLLNPNQHGFRCGRDCLTQLLHHFDDILKVLAEGSNTDVIYLDFAKAFDKVDHSILLVKLANIGVRGKLLQWIKCFLEGRTQRVVVNGIHSSPAKVISGVPQGTVLGPLLFIIYINDLPNAIKRSRIKIFADDSKLQKVINGADDHVDLQTDLLAVSQWAKDNNMLLNEGKFELIHFGKQDILKQPYVLPSGEPLEASNNVRDLGVIADNNLSWNAHINNKVDMARRMSSWVLRTFQSREPSVITLLFSTFVRPHLEYCCPLWTPHTKHNIKRIEAPQRKITKKINGMTGLDYWERLRALKLYSLQRRRERYIICTMWKTYHQYCPNNTGMNFKCHQRLGPRATRPLQRSRSQHIATLRHNYFTSTGPALFNITPKEIKEEKDPITFKRYLDRFLQEIPDRPPTPGYASVNNNSILEWGMVSQTQNIN